MNFEINFHAVNGSVSFAGGFLLVMTVTLLVTNVHELWAKKRRGQQTQESDESPFRLVPRN